MKNIRIAGVILPTLVSVFSYGQKTISEGTLTYKISTQSENKLPGGDPLAGATNTVYLKGSLSRTDMVSPLGKETTIYDEKNGAGVILKEYSGQKLMITLTRENWITQNKKFEGIVFETTSERKIITGYNCTKATAKLKDGSIMIVYFAPDVNIINKEYNQTFKNLQGLPVQYEFQSGKLKFIYILATVDLGPVPVAKFDFPKSGYRVMTYDENHQGKKESN
jgi:GLPGLI family protein